jgi:hypothetical protein
MANWVLLVSVVVSWSAWEMGEDRQGEATQALTGSSRAQQHVVENLRAGTQLPW